MSKGRRLRDFQVRAKRKIATVDHYPLNLGCKDWGRQDNIEAELERDRQSFERDEVELNDEVAVAVELFLRSCKQRP